MEQKELIHQILQAVEAIEKYTDTFVEQEQIPLVEVDIALEKTRKLYDFLHQLKNNKPLPLIDTANNTAEEFDSEIEENETIELLDDEDVQEEEIQVQPSEDVEEQIIEQEEKEEIQIQDEPIEIKEVVEELVTETTEVVQEEIIEEEVEEIIQEEEEIIIAEPQVQSAKSNTVVPQGDNDLAHKLSKKPISNIATAIGINDRFQFQNELFNKQAELYTETIQELNNLQNFSEALDLLQAKFDWDYEDTIVQRFIGIVERRYL